MSLTVTPELIAAAHRVVDAISEWPIGPAADLALDFAASTASRGGTSLDPEMARSEIALRLRVSVLEAEYGAASAVAEIESRWAE